MKIIKFLIALFPVLLLTSAFSDEQFGSNPGQKAAPIELCNDTDTLNLADLQGKYVLLSFWSSTDATSRQLCKEYDTYCSSNSNTKHISVCLDQDAALFEAIVERDGLNPASQFFLSGNIARKVIRDYHLDGALGTLLIGPDGRVVDVNPTEKRLARL